MRPRLSLAIAIAASPGRSQRKAPAAAAEEEEEEDEDEDEDEKGKGEAEVEGIPASAAKRLARALFRAASLASSQNCAMSSINFARSSASAFRVAALRARACLARPLPAALWWLLFWSKAFPMFLTRAASRWCSEPLARRATRPSSLQSKQYLRPFFAQWPNAASVRSCLQLPQGRLGSGPPPADRRTKGASDESDSRAPSSAASSLKRRSGAATADSGSPGGTSRDGTRRLAQLHQAFPAIFPIRLYLRRGEQAVLESDADACCSTLY